MSAQPTERRRSDEAAALEEQIEELQLRVRQAEERRRALIHIMRAQEIDPRLHENVLLLGCLTAQSFLLFSCLLNY